LKGNAIEAVSAIAIDDVMRMVVSWWNLSYMWTANHCEGSVK